MISKNTVFLERLREVIPESEIRIDEPLSVHTTFKVGGMADIFIKCANAAETSALIKLLNITGHEYYILGKGSNILVGDKGYRGIIISLDNLNEVECDGQNIVAGAGVSLAKIASVAMNNSLTGLEFASGIPGSLGGALVMNAGAYGGEMKDVVVSVDVITPTGDIFTLSNEEMKFAYRDSVLKHEKLLCIGAKLKLTTGKQEDIKNKMNELALARRTKQPLEYPSAGSTFKRPEGYFAGKLIMDAGLSGYTIGGAQVSAKHCGFVINIGNATAADIKDVIDEVAQKVYDRFGVRLEPEVCMLGDF